MERRSVAQITKAVKVKLSLQHLETRRSIFFQQQQFTSQKYSKLSRLKNVTLENLLQGLLIQNSH